MFIIECVSSGCCVGLAKLKSISRRMNVGDSWESVRVSNLLKGNQYSAHWSMRERGRRKER